MTQLLRVDADFMRELRIASLESDRRTNSDDERAKAELKLLRQITVALSKLSSARARLNLVTKLTWASEDRPADALIEALHYPLTIEGISETGDQVWLRWDDGAPVWSYADPNEPTALVNLTVLDAKRLNKIRKALIQEGQKRWT